MNTSPEYSSRERFWLWTLAIIGAIAINGMFLYGFLFVPGAFRQAMGNPVSLAFMLEAGILLAAMTYLLARWGVSRISRTLFVMLSVLGSMAFAIPAALLWPQRDRTTAA